MKLICREFSNKEQIPLNIRKQLYTLSLYSDGGRFSSVGSALVDGLVRLYKYQIKIKIAYLLDDANKVISWGSLNENNDIHVYTRKNFREHGFGKKIYTALTKKHSSDIFVYPHSDASIKFYSNFNNCIINSNGCCECQTCLREF